MRRVFKFSAKFPAYRSTGFTLVEMIVSIVIAGILVSMVAMFGRRQVDAYIDVGNRAQLADEADTALRRIARDLQSALPNSVRLDVSHNFLEFVPIRDAGRYRADVGAGGTGNILDFTSSSDSSFDVLGPGVAIGAGEELVIYNLGQTGSDVYAGTSRRSATPGTALTTVTFAPGGVQFPFASPSNRFQIVAQPVTYQCDVPAGVLRRLTGYGFKPAQPLLPADFAGASSAILVNDVSACSFNYTPAVLQRNGLAVLRLTLTRNGESVQLLHQVAVLNTP